MGDVNTEMSTSERRGYGLKLSSNAGGKISSGLDPELLLKADKIVALAESKVKKTEDKISIADKEIPAMQEFKEIIKNICDAVQPLSVYSSGHGLEGEETNLFDDYQVTTTSQDIESDPAYYMSVSRVKDSDNSLKFLGSDQDHLIHITQLAQSDSYEFSKQFISANDPLGFDGTLKLNGTSCEITVNQSLNTILKNINATEGIGIELGKIKNDSGNYIITIKSKESGLANALDLTDNSLFFDETSNIDGDRLFDGLTNSLALVTNKTKAALDAIIEIDGSSPISYSSNKITNAISGIEFNLRNANSGPNQTITIKLFVNVEEVTDAIINYAAATNELNKFVALHTKRTTEGEFSEGADLQKQRTFLENIYYQIRNQINSQSLGVSGDLKSLINLGFTDRKIEETRNEDGVVIPSHNALQLQSKDSTRNIVKERFEEVRQVFEFSFDTDDSALNLLSYKNKMLDAGILKFSLVINKDNLSGNDPVTGLLLNNTKKAAITYTKHTGQVVTIYPPKVEMTGSLSSNMQVSFPSRYADEKIDGYDARSDPFEGFSLLYENIAAGDVVVNVNMSQGSGNKFLTSVKEFYEALDGKIKELKSEKKELNEDKKRHEEEVEKKTAKFQAKMQRDQEKIAKAEHASSHLKALREARNNEE